MAREKKPVKTAFAEYLAERPAAPLDEAEFEELSRRFPSSSRSYLRKLVRDSGAPLAPLVEGVRQETLDELQRTLLALEQEYARAVDRGDLPRQQACRRAVIEAKDHARWALRRAGATPGQRKAREEAIEWMRVWLENPPVFEEWARLRRARVELG
ncbi:MAG: hypothetical protein KIT09_33635 [Bryobacteraceae bacterium]|nr:hypothetical protein [Bryobacteraceae bacterium]